MTPSLTFLHKHCFVSHFFVHFHFVRILDGSDRRNFCGNMNPSAEIRHPWLHGLRFSLGVAFRSVTTFLITKVARLM